MTVLIADRCTACGACLATCPEHALTAAPRKPVVIDDRCTDCLACLEVCPVDAIVPHPIEVESYRRIAERVDLSSWPDGARDVVARMIHATADESFATSTLIGDTAVAAAVEALRAGCAVVCDSRMVVAGIPSVPGAVCLLDDVPVAPPGDTRAAAAIRLAAGRYPTGALWVIGNAPTALVALLASDVCPAAVIGLPVGYVSAAEAKSALWDSPWRTLAVTNTGERGGSPVAAAAVNALARLAGPGRRPDDV